MADKNQFVVPHQDDWAVESADNRRVTSVHDTQQDAIDTAWDIARRQKSILVIHRLDGRTRDTDSYGNDSFLAKG